MSERRASLVGFDGVRFRVQSTDGGVYPDWQYQPTIVTRHIPGSNSAITQVMGTPPATLTLRLVFADIAAYRAFMAKQAVTGRLTLLANLTSASGTVEHLLGRDYEHLYGVLLTGISDTVVNVDKSVECSATFLRAMDPATGRAS